MAALIVAGVLVPVFGSVALIRLTAAELWFESRLLAISVGVVAGLAVSSLLYAVSIFAFGPRWPFFVPAETALWIGLLAISFKKMRWRQPARALSEPLSRSEQVAGAVLVLVALLSVLHFYLTAANFPSGEWDAWAIWNQRARFLHRGLDGHWRDGFALGWSHPDYPLMLPSSVARLWHYAGFESTFAPTLLAGLFMFSSAGLIVGGLLAQRRRLEGLCAGAILLSSGGFNAWGVAQVADVPLAAFVLGTTILLSRAVMEPRSRPLRPAAVALLGLLAGSAAWTKNEGLVFAAASLVVVGLLWMRRVIDARVLTAAFAGSLLPLATLVYFKLTVATSNYLFTPNWVADMIARVLDVSRHRFILRSFLGEFWSWHTGAPVGLFPLLVAYAGVGCVLRGARLRQLIAAAPLVVVVFSYYGVYLVTPLDLKWQIATSLARILVHVVPAFVYLCFAFPTDAGRHAAPVPVGLPMELQRGDGQFSAGPRI